jgi:hypothetical protein
MKRLILLLATLLLIAPAASAEAPGVNLNGAHFPRARARQAERRVAPAERPAGAVDGDNGCHP